MKRFLPLILLAAVCSGCPSGGDPEPTPPPPPVVTRPAFDEDSAFAYVAKQVEFGPRVPGTDAHTRCGDWLVRKLGSWADDVIEQTGTVDNWDGRELPMRNIVARFQPDASRRVLLCAHWDTRPVADQDDERQSEPIDGANDGGSGVGVLLEVARQLAGTPVEYGIDIVLFDVEDGGNNEVQHSYCLGSQYWGRTPHVEDYRADFGILLDMVGAEGAYFYKEGISMHFAPDIVTKVWDAAARAGARSWFFFNEGDYPELTADHLYVNMLTGIPTIDIIQYDRDNPKGFGDFWHTHDDNLDLIDPKTLNAVGETVLEVLYSE